MLLWHWLYYKNYSRELNMSIEPQGNTQAMRRTGWILSGIVIAIMAADAGADLLAIEPISRDRLSTR